MRAVRRVFAFASAKVRIELEVYSDCRVGYGYFEEMRLELSDSGYHGAGKGSNVFDRCEVAEPDTRFQLDGQPLYACASDEANKG